MFDFVVRIMGSGIASVIYFLSVALYVGGEGVTLEATLQDPLTQEIASLVKQGYSFEVEYYSSLIVNDKKVYKSRTIHTLQYYDNQWLCNQKEVSLEELQKEMGDLSLLFRDYAPQEGDKVLLFVKASIKNDEEFEKSTGLKTKILWENYIPREKKKFLYQEGGFKEL